MKKVLFFLCFFFLFNTPELDSNTSKQIIYDKNLTYDEKNYKVYFIYMNSNELDNILNKLDIRVLSYIIDDKKYYARSIDELVNNYIKDKNLSDKIYYEKYGIKIDGINIISNTYELNKLESMTDIF